MIVNKIVKTVAKEILDPKVDSMILINAEKDMSGNGVSVGAPCTHDAI